jgi:hypothetical protein
VRRPQLVGRSLEHNPAVAQHDEISLLDLRPRCRRHGMAGGSPGCGVGGDVEGVTQLVGDQHRGHPLQVAQLDDLGVDGQGGHRVEAGGRLVVEQESRLEGHRPGDGDAATLPARQFRRHLVDVLAEVDEPEDLFDAPTHLIERHVGLFVELEPDVLANGQRVEQRALLEHHAGRVAHRQQLLLTHPIDLDAVDPDPAGVGRQQAERELEDGRLAGAAGAEKNFGEAGIHLEADALQDHLVVEGQVDVIEHDHRLVARSALGRSA